MAFNNKALTFIFLALIFVGGAVYSLVDETTGVVRITTQPKKALIFVGGERKGFTQTGISIELEAGEHVIEAIRRGDGDTILYKRTQVLVAGDLSQHVILDVITGEMQNPSAGAALEFKRLQQEIASEKSEAARKQAEANRKSAELKLEKEEKLRQAAELKLKAAKREKQEAEQKLTKERKLKKEQERQATELKLKKEQERKKERERKRLNKKREKEAEKQRVQRLFGTNKMVSFRPNSATRSNSFVMGDSEGDEDERPAHQVTLTHSFEIGKYEVTQEQWRAVMGENPSQFRDESRPVDTVSWNSAQKFLAALNQKMDLAGKPDAYRLPSEAEWEYAARAGTQTQYSWGNDVGERSANCDGCGSRWDNVETAPIGSFESNPWGLHDMHGNVWEWVQDCYSSRKKHTHPTDGPQEETEEETETCKHRILRGGSWSSSPSALRAANRYPIWPAFKSSHFGLRLARTLSE